MAIDRFYTPQALSEATGLCVSQCRSLIAQSPLRICVSKNPESKRPRWAISESGFKQLEAEMRAKAQTEQRQKHTQQAKPKKNVRKASPVAHGMNPDGTIMNSRQLKAAGLWNR